jgi:hypothetical protein
MRKETKIIAAMGLLCLICIAVGGITVASFSWNQATPEKVSGTEGGYATPDITQVGSFETKASGHNKVTIKATFINNNEDKHSATITLSLLTSTGDVLTIGGVEMTEDQEITDLGFEEQVTLKFVFHGHSINDADVYEKAFAYIYQTA